ncbi:hypothetical protein [Streptomyces sp. NPDC096030]|uniref:hypothetical protein n=1 Tax=Streptomyces sp. NPDC096030 TaxID=3155423 RepID=UPI00332D63BC
MTAAQPPELFNRQDFRSDPYRLAMPVFLPVMRRLSGRRLVMALAAVPALTAACLVPTASAAPQGEPAPAGEPGEIHQNALHNMYFVKNSTGKTLYLTFATGDNGEEDNWATQPPEEIKPGQEVQIDTEYWFLTPDDLIADYTTLQSGAPTYRLHFSHQRGLWDSSSCTLPDGGQGTCYVQSVDIPGAGPILWTKFTITA